MTGGDECLAAAAQWHARQARGGPLASRGGNLGLVVEEYVEPGVEDVIDGVDEGSPEQTEDGSEAATWEPAPIAGRYRIGEYLATSRLGRTYRAWDTETDQDVEVTFLDADAVADTTGVEEWLEALRDLKHLHVLPLLDWEIAPVPYSSTPRRRCALTA